MKISYIVWICFILLLITFLVLICVASAYSVINCTNSYQCEDGLSITPDYTTRKNVLSIANILSWFIIILYIVGIILSDSGY